MTTLHRINPEYIRSVRRRAQGVERLDCLVQAARLIRESVPAGASCLDVGCASGYFYPYVRDHVGSYTGIDVEPAYLRIGRRRAKARGETAVSLLKADALTFEPGEPFDVLACLGLFYVFPNYHHVLEKFFSLARRLIVIRSLFEERTRYRYVPVMPGSAEHTYYNIHGFDEIAGFAASRGWTARFIPDDHVLSLGGRYETAGMSFPFVFLALEPMAATSAMTETPP